MSNPALFRALRADRLDHVAPRSRGDAVSLFEGEVLTRQVVNHSAGEYHFSDKAKREEGGKDKDKGESKGKKKSPIHAKGSDADGDGKKNESKKRDRNSDGDDSDSWDDEVRGALGCSPLPVMLTRFRNRMATASPTRWTRTARRRRGKRRIKSKFCAAAREACRACASSSPPASAGAA